MVSAAVFVTLAVVRIAFAASAVHSVHHSPATAASRPTDTPTAMTDDHQQFRQVPDTIRTSHGSELAMSSEDDPDSDEPEAEPTPGQPMLVPTPSR
jgi:hypothetical protein